MGIQAGEGRAGLEFWPGGYRARCALAGCGNVERVILRRVASSGTPDGQDHFCMRHARAGVAKAKADGIGIYDMGTSVQKLEARIMESAGTTLANSPESQASLKRLADRP